MSVHDNVATHVWALCVVSIHTVSFFLCIIRTWSAHFGCTHVRTYVGAARTLARTIFNVTF